MSRFLALMLCLSLLAPVHADEAQVEVKKIEDLEYAKVDGESLRLDLYLPKNVENPPLVVWIHGGGWRGGSRKKVQLKELVTHGYALASISYRFTNKAIFPAQIHDCKGAIRWLRANAEEYGYNADSITVGGSSAGGHLALLIGVSAEVKKLEGTVGGNLDQSSRVQGIIDYYGPSDFILRGKTQPERAYTTTSGSFALLGGVKHGEVIPELQNQASPAQYVTADDPPLLVFHGTDDETVLLDQSERIVELYRSADLPVELIILKGAGHGGKRFYSGKNFSKVLTFLAD